MRDEFKRFDEIFDDLCCSDFSPLLRSGKGEASSFPVYNTIESDADWKIEIAAPGAEEENFDLELDGDRLVIKYQKKQEEDKEVANYHHRALSFRSFTKQFTLPSNVDTGDISANLEKGVLTLILPKMADKKLETKKIEFAH